MNQPKKNSRKRTFREWYADTSHSASQAFGNVIDYFEWTFHRFFEGIGKVATSVSALLFPHRLLDAARKKAAQRASQRAEELEQRGAGKFIETLEYFFHRFMAGLGFIFNSVCRLFVPAKLIESTEKTVKHKAIDFFWDVRYRFKKLVERLSPPWLLRRLEQLRTGSVVLGRFFVAWLRSRDYKKLAWSTPAMLLAVPLVAVVAVSPIYSVADKIRHYQVALNAAIEENDGAARELHLSKLAQLGYRQLERVEFQAALALVDEENWEEAYTRMLTIAPVSEPGFPAAHTWIAGALVHGLVEETDRWKLAEVHANHALVEDAKNPYALRFLADVALQSGRIAEAIDRMEKLTGTFPDLHAELMHLTRQTGDFTAARKHARRAIATFEKLEPDEKNDLALTALGFLRWASAHEMLGRREDMVATLEQGIAQYPQDSALRKALANSLSSQVAKLDINDPNARALLKRVLELDPLNQPAQLVLARGLLSQDETTARVVEEFKNQSLLAPTFFLMVGDLNMNSGEPARAIHFYQQACEVDPKSARGWNNIAWIWSNIEPLRIEEALQAANRSIAADPDPRYIETRGQIYFKLERWKEAADNLERALNGSLPNSGPTHLTLAQAYEKLGDFEQAIAHRRLLTSNGRHGSD